MNEELQETAAEAVSNLLLFEINGGTRLGEANNAAEIVSVHHREDNNENSDGLDRLKIDYITVSGEKNTAYSTKSLEEIIGIGS